jgi:hypothetical protein
MVGEGSLCDSTVDRQSNSPMRKHFGRAPGLHHDMTLADMWYARHREMYCRPRGKRRGVQRVLKRGAAERREAVETVAFWSYRNGVDG